MSARRSIPTHRLGVQKRTLLDVEMPRLVRLLQAELPDYEADAISKRVAWIKNKAKSLLTEDRDAVITTMKEHLETLCKDEALRSHLLRTLEGRAAA